MFPQKIKILLFLSVILSGCVSASNVGKSDVPSADEDTTYIIKDLRTLAQDATFYLGEHCSSINALSPEAQKRLDEKFNANFFAPWQQKESFPTKDHILQNFTEFRRNLGFGENKREHTNQWIEHLIELANMRSYPNAKKFAITIRNTSLRVLPTHKPHFNDFNLAGEGYPFDNLQISTIFANTPLFIYHFTTGQSWAFVKSPLAEGWLAATDIAFVDDNFINQWKMGKYVALIKDNVAITDEEGIFRFNGLIGSIFPKIVDDEKEYKIFIAVADINGMAVIKRAVLPTPWGVLKPMEFSPLNVAKMINELLNQPYGWGGSYENRDCSSLIKDLFTPFGLWLPRNSAAQVRSGKFIPLTNLNPQEKENIIVHKSVPFMTLLRKEGHIMLYIGHIGNKAIIFHTLWGVKTKNSSGKEGRQVIGQSVITSLRPGIELSNLDTDKGDVLGEINGMTLLFSEVNPQVCH